MIPSIDDFPNQIGAVILQPDGDGGDSPQRTAMYFIGREVAGFPEAKMRFMGAMVLLTNKDDQLVRQKGKWDDPKDISRDQQEPWTIALAVMGFPRQARKIIFQRWRRFGFYPNGDFENPSGLAVDLRALGWWWAYPLILFGDLWSVATALFDSVHVAFRGGKDGPWLDMDNAVTRLSFAQIRYPTPFAWLARKIYLGCFPILFAIENKHREGAGNPAMARLWRYVLEGW